MSQHLADTIAWTTTYNVLADLRPALGDELPDERLREVFISIKAGLETYLTILKQDLPHPQPSLN